MLRLPHVGRALAGAAKSSLAAPNTRKTHFCVFMRKKEKTFTVQSKNTFDLFVFLLAVRTPARAASNMVEVFIDGKPLEVEPGTTVLQVRQMILLQTSSFRLVCVSVCEVTNGHYLVVTVLS